MRNEIAIPQLLDTALEIHEGLRQLILRARPPVGGPGRLRVGLVLTIAEQFEAALRLARTQMITHSALHVRSMIEAFVAMNMLELDGSYVDQMKFEKVSGELRVYKGILEDPNIPEEMKGNIRERSDRGTAERQALRDAGVKPKKTSELFGVTKLWHLVAPYSMLCAFTHNDLIALMHRHEGEAGMVYKRAELPEFVESVVATGLVVLMGATEQFGRLAKFRDDCFDSAFFEMNEKWRSVMPETEA